MKKLFKWTTLILIAMGSLALGAQDSEMKTEKLSDWCTITYPAKAKIGTPLPVKVQITGIDQDCKLNMDVHFFKKDGSFGGFYAWGGDGREVKANVATNYDYKFNIVGKENLDSITLLIYTSESGGWDNKIKDVRSAPIPVD